MLLIDETDQLTPLAGSTVRKCAVCEKRRASWKGPFKSGVETLMCGWCVLYAGSQWGHAHRDEVLLAGIQIRQRALESPNHKVHIPELDERHRLMPEAAERLMLGVGYTSIHLRPHMRSILSRLRGTNE